MRDEVENRLFELIRADYARLRELSGNPVQGSVWRAFVHPRVAPIALFRIAHWLYTKRLTSISNFLSLFILFVFRVEIPSRAIIGPGLVLPHPMGIVIGSALIGRNVTIFQNVTLGAREFDGKYDLTKRPRLHDGVVVGAGAVVLGPVEIGKNVVVKANGLITRNIPDSVS